ncbi:MAG TPA: response regulator [Candidatus Angelobacter sp.]|nr:response regulator [Candidatus Angelobacter sp.]
MTRILIAEDNPVNLELLREVLSSIECEIVEAKDGQEALERIAGTVPDIVLLDINMPVLDGLSVIRKIREQSQYDHIPFIAITAYAMKNDRERILAAGFSAYVAKPIDPITFLAELRKLMSMNNNLRPTATH